METPALLSAERLLVVTADTAAVEKRLHADVEYPRQDFHALADALDARIVSFSDVQRRGGFLETLIQRFFGRGSALALFAARHRAACYFTTAENAGFPLAFLLKFLPAAQHGMIAHKISTSKKRVIANWLHLFNQINQTICYSSTQLEYAHNDLGIPSTRIHCIPFQVDTDFYCPSPDAAPHTGEGVVSVGRELRDYGTLFEAVRPTDIPVTVIASSPWSQREDQTRRCEIPDNVTLDRNLSYTELRELYRNAGVVVTPLQNVDSAAGVTTVLEAQAVGKPVIVSRTPGILDSIEPGENAMTVPCGDPSALREAIQGLLRDPDRADRLGRAARQSVMENNHIDHFVQRISRICRWPQREASVS